MSAEELPEKPLLEHVYDLLETLRRMLIYSLVFILALYVVPSPLQLPGYSPLIFDLMAKTNEYMLDFNTSVFARPFITVFGLSGKQAVLISHGWFDALTASLLLAGLLAVVVLSPLHAYLIYRFVEPALYPHEKKVVRKYMIFSLALFLLGSIYGYFVVMPIVFAVGAGLATLGGAALLFSIQEFYQNLFLGVLSTGVFFMFPLAVLTLHKIGLVSSETLSKQWRYVVFAIFATLAFITPDPTLVTDLVLGVPFMALYFLSIWLVKRSEKKGRKSG